MGDTVLALVNKTPVDYTADAKVDPEESKSRDNRTTYSPEMGRIWSGIRSPRWSHGKRAILAFDAKDGRPLWQKPSEVIPLTLAADSKHVYFHDTHRVVALDIANGEEAWSSDPVPVWEGLQGQGLQSWFAPTLVVHNGTVIFAGGEKTNMSYVGYATDDIGQDTMTAFSADTGKKVWTAASPFSGYNSPEDVFVAPRQGLDRKHCQGRRRRTLSLLRPQDRRTGRQLPTHAARLLVPPPLLPGQGNRELHPLLSRRY